MSIYQYDKPLLGEDVLSYLARHNALPGANARQASEDEVAECDRTEEYLGSAFIIVPQDVTTRRIAPRRRGR